MRASNGDFAFGCFFIVNQLFACYYRLDPQLLVLCIERREIIKRYTILHPIFMSFYSKSLYQHVGRNWKGTSFIYLLLLLALSWIFGIIQVHYGASDFITNTAPGIVEQVPRISISDGEVSIDASEPYFITDPESGDLLIIIDTTGQITSLYDNEAKLLLTKTKVIVENGPAETRMYDLSEIGEFYIDQRRANSFLEVLKDWLAIVLYPFAVLLSFIYRIIQALIYAAIGTVFAKKYNASLNYQALISLAIISITPVIVLDTILSLLIVPIPFWPVLCFFISMGFLSFAVKVNSEEAIEEHSGAGS